MFKALKKIFLPLSFNNASTYGFGGQSLTAEPVMPPELLELVNQSLDVEPENWAFYDGNHTTKFAVNGEAGIEVRWGNGPSQLVINFKDKAFGRPMHWTKGLPWSKRGRIVKRLEGLRDERWQQRLNRDFGFTQAAMEVRNAGKPPGDLPVSVIGVPGPVPVPGIGQIGAAQSPPKGAPRVTIGVMPMDALTQQLNDAMQNHRNEYNNAIRGPAQQVYKGIGPTE